MNNHAVKTVEHPWKLYRSTCNNIHALDWPRISVSSLVPMNNCRMAADEAAATAGHYLPPVRCNRRSPRQP
jgi:hypothetical protein